MNLNVLLDTQAGKEADLRLIGSRSSCTEYDQTADEEPELQRLGRTVDEVSELQRLVASCI